MCTQRFLKKYNKKIKDYDCKELCGLLIDPIFISDH